MKPIAIDKALHLMLPTHAYVLTELDAKREIKQTECNESQWRIYVYCHATLNRWGLLAGPGKGLTEQGKKVLTEWNKKHKNT